jgi:type IV pilus assembly protein PilZ
MTSKSAKKSPTGTPSRARKVTSGTADIDGGEERGGRRVPIQLLVDYKADGNYLFDFCKDLGTGGVFIQTTKPLPTGSSIDLTFTIPDSKETLMAKGKVIWVQNPVADRKDLTPGMGVQFDGFSVEQRRLLEDFVQRYNARAVTPTHPDKRAV